MPAQPRPLVGFANLGNTCFVNSALQVLFSSKIILARIASHVVPGYRKNCVACAVAVDYLSALRRVGSDDEVSPDQTLGQLQRLMPGMVPGSQQDSHAFLLSLLNTINNELAEHQVEMGECVYTTECNSCTAQSENPNPCWNIPVPVVESVDAALNAYFAPERVSGDDNKIQCGACGVRSTVTRSQKIKTPPEILIVQLARFQFKEGHLQRVDGKTLIPMELNLSEYRDTLSPPRPEDRMRCVGMVIHSGQSLQEGHYRAITVTGRDKFRLFDDHMVRAMRAIEAYERDDVYFVVYERSTKPPQRQQLPASPTPAVKNYATDTATPEDVLRAESPLPHGRSGSGPRDLVPPPSEQSTPDTTKTIVPLKPTKTYEKPKKTQPSTTAPQQAPARFSLSISRALRDAPGRTSIGVVEGRWQPVADESLAPQHLSSGSETPGSARPEPRQQPRAFQKPGAPSPLASSTPTATAGAGPAEQFQRPPPPTHSTPTRAVDETEASSESGTTATKTIVLLKPTKNYEKPKKSESSSTARQKVLAAWAGSSSLFSRPAEGRWQDPRADESPAPAPQQLSSSNETPGSARQDPRRESWAFQKPGAPSPLASSTPTGTAGAGLARHLWQTLPPPTHSTPTSAVDETEASSESSTTATKTIVPLKPTKTYEKPKSDSSSTAPRKAAAAPSGSSSSSTSHRAQGRWQPPRVDESLDPQQLSSGGETRVPASPQRVEASVEAPCSAADVVASALRACGGGLSPLATPSPQGPELPLLLTPSPIKSSDFTDLEPMWTWATRSDPGASALRSTCRPVRSDGTLVDPWCDSSEEESRDRLPAPTSCHEPVPVRHLKCTQCCARFRDQRSLQRHLLRHSLIRLGDRRLYSCCYCASSFRTVDLLHRHLRLHVDDSDLLQCPKKFCSMQCRNVKMLRRHLTAHRVEKKSSNMPHRNLESLTLPSTRMDRNQPEEAKPKSKPLRHQCRLCKRCFDDCKTLRRHHRTFGERGDQTECRVCERRRQRIQNFNDKRERIVPWENHKNFVLRTIGLWS